jgi:hypothetical protein
VSGRALTRFFCHCGICRAVYRAPCADVVVFRATSVRVLAPDAVTFRTHRPPPAVRRGTCNACLAPVAGFVGLGESTSLAFVPARNLEAIDALPAPAAHVFYDCRTEPVDDALPKYEGYWRSELAALRLIAAGARS